MDLYRDYDAFGNIGVETTNRLLDKLDYLDRKNVTAKKKVTGAFYQSNVKNIKEPLPKCHGKQFCNASGKAHYRDEIGDVSETLQIKNGYENFETVGNMKESPEFQVQQEYVPLGLCSRYGFQKDIDVLYGKNIPQPESRIHDYCIGDNPRVKPFWEPPNFNYDFSTMRKIKIPMKHGLRKRVKPHSNIQASTKKYSTAINPTQFNDANAKYQYKRIPSNNRQSEMVKLKNSETSIRTYTEQSNVPKSLAHFELLQSMKSYFPNKGETNRTQNKFRRSTKNKLHDYSIGYREMESNDEKNSLPDDGLNMEASANTFDQVSVKNSSINELKHEARTSPKDKLSSRNIQSKRSSIDRSRTIDNLVNIEKSKCNLISVIDEALNKSNQSQTDSLKVSSKFSNDQSCSKNCQNQDNSRLDITQKSSPVDMPALSSSPQMVSQSCSTSSDVGETIGTEVVFGLFKKYRNNHFQSIEQAVQCLRELDELPDKLAKCKVESTCNKVD